jgi:hypothetical protein
MTTNGYNAEYRAALDTHTEAAAIFRKAELAYRARQIGDAEILAARKAFDQATETFDAAFAKASGWNGK